MRQSPTCAGQCYIGEPPDADRPLSAAFAHALAFRDARIIQLRQITDSQRWVEAAAAADLAAVRRMFEAVERRDAETLMSVYADDIVITEASSLPYGGVYHGHDGATNHGIAYVETGIRSRPRRIECCNHSS